MNRRHAFTLIELLIVLLVLGLALALAWPRVESSYRRSRAKSAANQVRIALAKARIAAIKSGQPYAFRFQPGTGHFEVGPRANIASQSLAASIAEQNQAIADLTAAQAVAVGPESLGSPASRPATTDVDTIGALEDIGDSMAGVVAFELVDGVVFAGVRLAEATRQTEPDPLADPFAAAVRQAAQRNDTNAWSEPIVFYPNGRTSSGVVRLSAEDGPRRYAIDITIRGLTGSTHVGQLRTGGLHTDTGVPIAQPTPSGPDGMPPAMASEDPMAALERTSMASESGVGYDPAWTMPPSFVAPPPFGPDDGMLPALDVPPAVPQPFDYGGMP